MPSPDPAPNRTSARPATADREGGDPRGGAWGRGRVLLTLIGALVAVATVLGMLVTAAEARPGALDGTRVAELEVGGNTAEEIAAAVATLPTASARDVTFTSGERTVTDQAAAFGYVVDVEATVDAVMERGRQTNLAVAAADVLRSYLGGVDVTPAHGIDESVLQARIDELGLELREPPREPEVAFEGAQVTISSPEPGEQADLEGVADHVRAALLDGGTTAMDLPRIPLPPASSPADIADLRSQAELALSADVTLERGDGALTLSPAQLATFLEARPQEDGPPTLAVSAERLDAWVDQGFRDTVATPPQDASFAVEGDQVSLVEAQPGFAFDAEVAADQLWEVASRADDRTAELAGTDVEPAFSTADVESLGITDLVGTFTTEHACCQNRVTNIQLIADLMDGMVLRPRESFSVNDFVGPRTSDDGFLLGGTIESGQMVDTVGGGISQFATTLYNAVYFGGYEILEHQPHSVWFSRYPLGREATLDYPSIDLAFRNDSPAGMLISTSYTDTSITVHVFGTQWVEVESITGERYGWTDPLSRVVETSALPRGQERVVQDGSGGFSVNVTRILRFPDGREERQEEVTRYAGQPRITERGTG